MFGTVSLTTQLQMPNYFSVTFKHTCRLCLAHSQQPPIAMNKPYARPFQSFHFHFHFTSTAKSPKMLIKRASLLHANVRSNVFQTRECV